MGGKPPGEFSHPARPSPRIPSLLFLAENREPMDLVYAANTVWFTERAGNRIGRIDVTTGDAARICDLPPNSGPTGIDVAPDGTVWFTEETGMKLAQFDPVSRIL